jgi:hypothetical protein
MTRRFLMAYLLTAAALSLPAVAPRPVSGKDKDREKRETRNSKPARSESADSKSKKADPEPVFDAANEAWLKEVPSSKRKDARRDLKRLQDARDADLTAATAERDAARRGQRTSTIQSQYQADLDKLKARYLPARRSDGKKRSGGELTDDQRRLAESAERKLRQQGRNE